MGPGKKQNASSLNLRCGSNGRYTAVTVLYSSSGGEFARLAVVKPTRGSSGPGRRPGPSGEPHGAAIGSGSLRTALRLFLIVTAVGEMIWLCGCRSPAEHRAATDEAAYATVRSAQRSALGRVEGFSVEPPSQTLRRRLLIEQNLPHSGAASLGSDAVERIPEWPDPTYGSNRPPDLALAIPSGAPLRITLLDALQIAARNSPEYQAQKEAVFEAALRLDLEREEFRSVWKATLASSLSTEKEGEDRVSGIENKTNVGMTQKMLAGASFAMNLGLDLVKLLTQDAASALGVMADATISVPLLRGSKRFVITEPLTQAERDVVYAIYSFGRFKQIFAVRIAAEYLNVLQQLDQVNNARDNYQRLVVSSRRARRLAEAGQLPQIQVDQARQDELRARNRWVSAQLSLKSKLDSLKALLGLPPDAQIELERSELDEVARRTAPLVQRARIAAEAAAEEALPADAPVKLESPSREGGGPLEMDEERAVKLALEQRLDLRMALGRVLDAQRATVVAADRLRADLLLLGRGRLGESRSLGSASAGNASFVPERGAYAASLQLDLPLNRKSERIAYRNRLLDFEKAVRNVQILEDQIKLAVRDGLRNLMESRETVAIQAAAVEVARRRLESTTMFFEAGRAAMRDLLEAEEALVSAQNALTAALVRYRVSELALQRDMGVLEIGENGLWHEYSPPDMENYRQ